MNTNDSTSRNNDDLAKENVNPNRSYGINEEHSSDKLITLDCATFSNAAPAHAGGTYQYRDSMRNMIGSGSFGQVFRGTVLLTDKNVAIKKIMMDEVKWKEIRIMETLRSPFLVELYDTTTFDANYYMIMEFCASDLEQHLGKSANSCLDEEDLRTLLGCISEGYMVLHKHRIVHRDIKPQNILINYNSINKFEHAKIGDFGISRLLNEEENNSCVNLAGSCEYMAPEIAANILRESQYDHQVDMWSIGCVLHKCITGSVPFDESNHCKLILYSACKNYEAYDPPVPEKYFHEVQGKLSRSLLELDPERRMMPNEFHQYVHSNF